MQATWQDNGPFVQKNGWRIEFSDDHPDYAARVCRLRADCAADVWGYYTSEQVRQNVHLDALRRAATA